MDTFLRLLYPLGLTILIEYPIVQIVWLIFKYYKKTKDSKLNFFNNKIVIVPALIVNVLTNPAINLFAWYMFTKTNVEADTIWTIISALEVLVVIVEGILYKFLLNTKWLYAFVVSFASNFISYMSSFLIQ